MGQRNSARRSVRVDAEWFKGKLEHSGKSSSDLARELGVDRSQISRMWSGDRQLQPSEIKRVAKFLHADVTEVLDHLDVDLVTDADEIQSPPPKGENKDSRRRHPAFGALRGTTIVMPGVDLTQPADPDWGQVYDD